MNKARVSTFHNQISSPHSEPPIRTCGHFSPTRKLFLLTVPWRTAPNYQNIEKQHFQLVASLAMLGHVFCQNNNIVATYQSNVKFL